jgi:DNA-binding response OmpR family regulator
MEAKKTSRAGKPAGAHPCDGTHRILVLDDDPAIRQSNVEMLTGSGYQVDAAEDGAAGWDALHAHTYDLLITDNSMPKVTGLELVKKLRSAHMALPIIMASGAIPEELTRPPWLQPGAMLLKPFTGDELLGAVCKVLRAVESVHEPNEPQSRRPSTDGIML